MRSKNVVFRFQRAAAGVAAVELHLDSQIVVRGLQGDAAGMEVFKDGVGCSGFIAFSLQIGVSALSTFIAKLIR